jgi:predicted Zn-dependent peptidase
MNRNPIKSRYESVKNDPIRARIYTLENGLRIFLSAYTDAPRIQAYIAVRTGSKMDPPETTGLAHYFEHMMFKGTETFSTLDWKKEKPLLQKIEQLFEIYRGERDPKKRAAIYREIDTVSYEASAYAIPNEYDKLMDIIGSQGSNAGTSNDYTIYMENIPANQVENWARIQSERFTKPVLRLFHTELETVYEEKNMSLTNDSRKVSESTLKALFPEHSYGSQTTLGEAEHLKNPSLKNIRKFFRQQYVPGNMAICLSGDLDPDATIEILERWFGKMKPAKVPAWRPRKWKMPDAVQKLEITGPEAESLRIAWGFPARSNERDAKRISILATLLSNGKAGLIDLHLNQEQKLLSANAYAYQLTDRAMLVLNGKPGPGQSLDEVKELLLEQVRLLKEGSFPEWMLEASVRNARLGELRQFESSQGRAMYMADAFLNEVPYPELVTWLDDVADIRKEEVVRIANKYLSENYVVIYKKQGQPDDPPKVEKPPITPVIINRDVSSRFLEEIRNTAVKEVKPAFLDYKKDLKQLPLPHGARILYRRNRENKLFTLTWHFPFGRNEDSLMHLAMVYLPFLGTAGRNAAQFSQDMYRIAASLSIDATEEDISVTLNGLGEHFEESLQLVNELLTSPVADKKALKSLVANALKLRQDARSSQNDVFRALASYGTYGPESPLRNLIPEKELKKVTAGELVAKILDLRNYTHDILYYGPEKEEDLIHKIKGMSVHGKGKLKRMERRYFPEVRITENRVLFAPYDSRQCRIETLIPAGRFDPANSAAVAMHFAYFGSNIVFQELREKRGLAYTAYNRIQEPTDRKKSYMSIGYIATQSDKMAEAIAAFDDLYEHFPESNTAYGICRDNLLERLRTERIDKMNVLWNYLASEKLGLEEDIRPRIFREVKKMPLETIRELHERWIAGRPRTYLVLGREEELDFTFLSRLGTVTKLPVNDLFGH